MTARSRPRRAAEQESGRPANEVLNSAAWSPIRFAQGEFFCVRRHPKCLLGMRRVAITRFRTPKRRLATDTAGSIGPVNGIAGLNRRTVSQSFCNWHCGSDDLAMRSHAVPRRPRYRPGSASLPRIAELPSHTYDMSAERRMKDVVMSGASTTVARFLAATDL
jgi:hypothetical protein